MDGFNTGYYAGRGENPIFKRIKREEDAGITGFLKDFGLTDLFQLLGQQQKTGVLTLQEKKKVVQVLFDKGRIVGASLTAESGEMTLLGKSLIRGGLLSPEKWKIACNQQKEELASMESILVKNGLVRTEDLTAVLRLLIFETIYGLFKWKGGTFRFESKTVFFDPAFIEPLNAEYLLLDVLRMVDEWPLLAERIPSFQMVLQKVNAGATLDILAGTSWEKKRTFQMDVIYELVNGQRTVQEIIDLSFVGEFDTCKNLILMMDAGAIESTSIGSGGERRRKIKTSSLLDAGTYFLVGVLTLFLIYQLFTKRESFPLSLEELEGWRTFQSTLQKIGERKAMNAREIFYLEENRYSTDRIEMLDRGLLSR